MKVLPLSYLRSQLFHLLPGVCYISSFKVYLSEVLALFISKVMALVFMASRFLTVVLSAFPPACSPSLWVS